MSSSERTISFPYSGVDTGPEGSRHDPAPLRSCHAESHHHGDKPKRRKEGLDGITGRPEVIPDGAPDGVNGVDRRPEHDEEKPDDGKAELHVHQAYDKLGFSFPWWKKWGIISVIFIVQVSMNFNAGFYASGVSLFSKNFGISEQAARVGQLDFLVAYAFGCELWAPWSEEFGRWPIMQLSLFLVNIWQIPCALAPNYATIVVCRILGGLSSAGGSVTLGMVADMWEPEVQQYAVAYVVLSSVGGSVVAPIVGGFTQKFLKWQWIFWLQLIFGGFAQCVHLFVPETRASILLTREAKRRRKRGEMVYSGDELKGKRITVKHVLMVWARPFIMYVREPIVLWLSLLSGFSDALIFIFLESYGPVYSQWGFGPIFTGLAFIP